jgi:hypothetical protein
MTNGGHDDNMDRNGDKARGWCYLCVCGCVCRFTAGKQFHKCFMVVLPPCKGTVQTPHKTAPWRRPDCRSRGVYAYVWVGVGGGGGWDGVQRVRHALDVRSIQLVPCPQQAMTVLHQLFRWQLALLERAGHKDGELDR